MNDVMGRAYPFPPGERQTIECNVLTVTFAPEVVVIVDGFTGCKVVVHMPRSHSSARACVLAAVVALAVVDGAVGKLTRPTDEAPRAAIRRALAGTPHMAALGTLGYGGRAAAGGPSPQQQMDDYIKGLSQCSAVTGFVATVVQHGDVVYESASGLRDIDNNLPVNQDTIFQIGSTTKAFTTALVGMMVDEGLVGWNDLVSDYLPDWKLYDEFANKRSTVADLLAHKTVSAVAAAVLTHHRRCAGTPFCVGVPCL